MGPSRNFGVVVGHYVAMDPSIRPWGHYEVLADAPDHKVKRIHVEPGRRISYQRHTKRSEHWFFLQGEGLATLDEEPVKVGPGDTIDIPSGMAHRIENVAELGPLIFIEVQHGTYFGEDDIIRLEDDFGRT